MAEGPYEWNAHVSINRDDTVIDCGANIGIFSAVASKKGVKVYAFEPDRKSGFHLLDKKCGIALYVY